MELSERTKIEASIGFTIGILIGATAAWVVIVFTTNWQWYFKLFSTLGSLGIIGSLVLSLMELFKARRNYLDAVAEMKRINANNKMDDEEERKMFDEEDLKGGYKKDERS